MTGTVLDMAATRVLAIGVLAAAAAGLGCTEDPLTGPGPEGQEGAETVEITVPADQFPVWRDTTYTGFALPLDADFLVAADPAEADDLNARALLKYRAIPDSVEIDSVDVAIDSFTSVEIRLELDTARSRIPDPGFRLRLFGLARPFTATEASWEEAADGEAWASPGGDLDGEIGSLDLQGASDSALAGTLVLPIQSPADSLLTNWRDEAGGNGAALLVEGPGARLTFTRADLRFEVLPEGRDSTEEVTLQVFLGNDPSTFIHDPPQPPVGAALRLGGLPAGRAYLTFVPPDSVQGLRLRDATINRAELVFRPLPPPAEPFALDRQVSTDAMELIADPFELGAKTPIGPSLSTRTGTSLQPDSLAAGRPLRVSFDSLMTRWAAAPDSFGAFRLGLRLQPDDQSLEFWEFGSAESPPALRPFVRLVVTPPSGFELP